MEISGGVYLMDLGYGLFMAERAGLLNTRKSRINRVCAELNEIHIENKWDKGAIEILIEEILHKNELHWNELTYKEQQLILDSIK